MQYDLDTLIKTRRHLHSIAELSGQEKQTSAFLISEMKKLNPDNLIENLGGYGFAVVFETHRPGLTICFRAELDALPIAEQNDFDYRSAAPEVSHKCGHDGHAVILLGLADWIKGQLCELSGRIILLFQPAEETAQGALAVLADTRFTELMPDLIFGLHNLPGFPLSGVILREKVFAAASCGLKIKLFGKTSHAAHPEHGISPLNAMLAMLDSINKLPQEVTQPEESAMVTIIHLCLGEEAFGTSPGEAEIMATFRAFSNKALDIMIKKTEQLVQSIAAEYKLKYTLQWVEKFAATINNEQAYSIVLKAVSSTSLDIIKPELPFRWTEDFSYFTERYKAAFFGLGAGESHPQLHNPDYDFPDLSLETGIRIFANIITEVVKEYAADKLD